MKRRASIIFNKKLFTACLFLAYKATNFASEKYTLRLTYNIRPMKYTNTFLDDYNWVRVLSTSTLEMEIREIMNNENLSVEEKERLISMRNAALKIAIDKI